LDFDRAAKAATGGAGVDVVLNALAGEAMVKSLDCLAPFGRFVELGKRDFLADTALGMRALRNNISYHAVDLDQVMRHRPARAAQLLDRLATALRHDRIAPLPHTVFAAGAVDEAFRRMSASGHIGKIVIRPPKPAPAPVPVPIRGGWVV